MPQTTNFICFTIERFTLRSFRFNATRYQSRLFHLFFHSFCNMYAGHCFVFTGILCINEEYSRYYTTCPTDAALIWLSKPSSVVRAVASFFSRNPFLERAPSAALPIFLRHQVKSWKMRECSCMESCFLHTTCVCVCVFEILKTTCI